MKIIIHLALVIGIVLFHPSSVEAAKKFVPRSTSSTTVRRIASGGGISIPAVVRYRGDKQGIYLYFSNFNGFDSVSYSFTYTSNGIPQGAGGTITNNNNPSAQRELLFGTCSSGVCTYHHNLTNARMVLTAHFSTGRVASKLFRIKTYQ